MRRFPCMMAVLYWLAGGYAVVRYEEWIISGICIVMGFILVREAELGPKRTDAAHGEEGKNV